MRSRHCSARSRCTTRPHQSHLQPRRSIPRAIHSRRTPLALQLMPRQNHILGQNPHRATKPALVPIPIVIARLPFGPAVGLDRRRPRPDKKRLQPPTDKKPLRLRREKCRIHVRLHIPVIALATVRKPHMQPPRISLIRDPRNRFRRDGDPFKVYRGYLFSVPEHDVFVDSGAFDYREWPTSIIWDGCSPAY